MNAPFDQTIANAERHLARFRQGTVEHLMDYAKARNSENLPAWRAYNQRLRSTGAIGIWHETYVVRPGGYENIYGNMPAFGLGKVALRHGRYETVGGKHDAARARLDG